MTKGEARELTLRWLDNATVNGSKLGFEIPADINDKFDYFLYQALNFIYGMFKKEAVFIPKEIKNSFSGFNVYELPSDLREIKGVICTDENSYTEIKDYKREGKSDILIPKQYKNIRIPYYVCANNISPFENDNSEIEISKDIEFLLPLKIAADIAATSEDTLALSAFLSDKFSAFALNLLDEKKEDIKGIETVYGI